MFSTYDVAALLGVSFERLKGWIRGGKVSPGMVGSVRIWTSADVLCAARLVGKANDPELLAALGTESRRVGKLLYPACEEPKV